MSSLTQDLKQRARDLGFVLAGVAPASMPGRIDAFHHWLAQGYAGQMGYLEDRRDAYRHPDSILDGCRSIVMLALPYANHDASPREAGNGKVARYAQGPRDYHDVIHERLKVLKSWLIEHIPNATARGIVDTAPLLEREVAELAGLGWIGKNTLLLNRQWGSYFFLAALLTDLELEPDAAQEQGYCGTCRACLDACPTNAFPEPYVLDASRCISYLTIEHRDHVAPELAEQFDGWLFGCDICQEVCPWNHWTRPVDPELESEQEALPLKELLHLDEQDYRGRFRATPMWRTKRRGLLRNALLLAATQKDAQFIPEIQSLLGDKEPLVRAAAAWALFRLAPEANLALLAEFYQGESDASVRSEVGRWFPTDHLNADQPNAG